MKQLLTIMILCCFLKSQSANKYFSNAGNDVTGTGTEGAPFATLAKATSIYSSLASGDSLLFKRGDSFSGTLLIGRTGVIIGAYSTGADPIFTGLTLCTWTLVGTNIYESQTLTLVDLNLVVKNNVMLAMGRWPQSTYRTFQTHNSYLSITDNLLTGTPNWTGAELVIRRRRWVLDRDSITLHSGNTISYVANVTAEPYNNYGYFIQNSVSTLTYQNSWWYNKTTRKLRMYSTSLPTGVYASTVDTIINNRGGFSGTVIDNINVVGANDFGLFAAGRTVFQNGDINFSGIDGVKLAASNCKINLSTISNSLNNGITYAGSSDSTTNSTIYNSNPYPGNGLSNAGQGIGILATNTSSYVRYNRVIKSGYTGIYINGNNSDASYNYVDSFCIVKDDGAGIYTNSLTHTGRKINYNIISNAIGSPAGGGDGSTLTYQASGIYSDNGSNRHEVIGNTVSNCALAGIFLHGGYSRKITGNTVYNTKYALYILEMSVGEHVNDTVKNNIFFSTGTTKPVYRVDLESNRLPSTLGIFDSNYLCRPILEVNVNNSGSSTSGGVIAFSPNTTVGYWGLGYWQTFGGTELNSKKTPKGLDTILFLRNPSLSSVTYPLNGYTWLDMRNVRYGAGASNNLTLLPYTSALLIRDTAANSTPNANPTVSITAPLTGATYTATATVSITATAADTDGTIANVKFYNGATLLNTDNASPYAYTWNSVGVGGYTLTAVATDNSGGTATSSPVSITVTAANIPPTVNIQTDSVNYTNPATVILTANGSDADGSISIIRYYQNGVYVGSSAVSPYTVNLTGLTDGTYSMTAVATDNTGDSTTSSSQIIYVTTPTPSVDALSATFEQGTILCNGQNTTVTVSATGGTEPYTGTGSFIRAAGTWQFIVIDNLGLRDTLDIIIDEPAVLTLSPAVGTITAYLGSTSVTLTPTGGTAPYEYSLDNVNWFTSNVFSVTAGYYTARIRDFKGCTANTTFSLTQPSPPPDTWIHPGKGKKFRNVTP